MDHANGVGGLKCTAYLLHDLDCFFGGQFGSLMDQGTQVLALDEFHGDELHAVGFAEVIDPHHVLVRDLGGEDELLLEAIDDGLTTGQVGANYFQRNRAVQFNVQRLVDGAHAAHAEYIEYLVAPTEHRSGFQNRCAGKDIDLPRSRSWRRGSADNGRCACRDIADGDIR